MKRINNANVNINNLGESLELYGWVAKKRNLGGLVFVDLRDRSGIVQLVINPESKVYDLATSLKSEYVIKVLGNVVKRNNSNSNLKSGEIEINVNEIEVLNVSKELPFDLNNTTALEDTRLKYRYLDMRRDEIKDKMILKHKVMQITRNFLSDNDFIEIETPILCKSTPEGARDYLVPSRVFNGKFFALPQSPQIFKQLLMVGGVERYFQIARCFRDEDLRADRQPEFTQIDFEMSFVEEEDVMNITEELVSKVFKDTKSIDVKLPLRRMTYIDAINDYGSDKPDLRMDMKIIDITDVFSNTEFNLFKSVIDESGIINCLVVRNAADKFSRKDLDGLTEFVKKYKALGIANLKLVDNEFVGSIKKIEEKEVLRDRLSLEDNDLVLVISGDKKIVKKSLGALRLELGKKLNLFKSGYELLWVTDFPSFEYSEEENRFLACHHPFTAPKDSDIDKLLDDKENCYSKTYDIVINGYEVGGGSIRIHNENIQEKMFRALELSNEDIESKFGFFVEGLKYGTPPHGGLAIGLDRLIMLLSNTENIKDVIAFPKTTSSACLMSNCPNIVDDKQLNTLGIKLKAQ